MDRVIVAMLLAGCSAWIDADSYRGGDGGPSDVGLGDASRSDADDGGVRTDAAPVDAGRDTFGSDPNEIGPDIGLGDAGDDTAPPRDVGPDAPCAAGADSDGDGVVDACDACPGFDDREDADGDRTPDGCDDWPCGRRPTIAARVAREFITISNVRIHTMGNAAVVRSNERFQIDYDYSIDDTMCAACVDQIEIGFTRIGRLQCPYNDDPPPGGASGTTTISNIGIPPGASGLYELRFNLGRETACPLGGAWFDGEPPTSQTIGAVCVVPGL